MADCKVRKEKCVYHKLVILLPIPILIKVREYLSEKGNP